MNGLNETLCRAVEQYLPSDERIDNILEDSEFDLAGQVHDWRNYVPDEVRALWSSLDHNARLAIILITKEVASNEEWE